MVKLNSLSPNLVTILTELLNNTDLVKYVDYNVKNPLSQPVVMTAQGLLMKKVYPFPFDPNATVEEGTTLRVYYPSGRFESKEIMTDTVIHFDIIVAKSLWLVNDGQPAIRPYEMMKLIINQFSDKYVEKVGRLEFERFTHLSVNEKFDAIRIYAKMLTIETG